MPDRMKPDGIKPIRRVVTGNDAQGRSRVLFDSAAPNVNPGAISQGTCMTDVWVYKSSPAVITGERDDGNLPFHFEPPHAGGHLRIVQSPAKPADYDPAKDPGHVAVARAAPAPRRRVDPRRAELLQRADPQIGDRRLRHRARRRARARPRLRRDRHASGRRRGAARQLARLDQSAHRQPDGLRHDGRKVRGRRDDGCCQTGPPHRHHRRRTRSIAWRSPTARRPTCAPIRRGPASPRRASGSRAASPARIEKQFRDASLCRTRSSRRRSGSVCRIVTIPPDASWRRKVGASEVGGLLPTDGLAARLDLRAERAASLHAEDAHARLLPDPRRRGDAGARHRGGRSSRPATPWCSAAPTTPGATASDQPCRIAISSHDAQ